MGVSHAYLEGLPTARVGGRCCGGFSVQAPQTGSAKMQVHVSFVFFGCLTSRPSGASQKPLCRFVLKLSGTLCPKCCLRRVKTYLSFEPDRSSKTSIHENTDVFLFFFSAIWDFASVLGHNALAGGQADLPRGPLVLPTGFDNSAPQRLGWSEKGDSTDGSELP